MHRLASRGAFLGVAALFGIAFGRHQPPPHADNNIATTE